MTSLAQLGRAAAQDPTGIVVLQDALLDRDDHRRLAVLDLLPPRVMVPPGTYLQGSPPDEEGHQEREGPQRQVTISRPFWLGAVPVTQALYEAVTGTNPSHFRGPDLPVERVSWNEAQAFCASLERLLPGFGFRLPTEAEWEYACRAGTTTARHGDLDQIAWRYGNSGPPAPIRGDPSTHPVGQLLPNAWGLHDMLGNVWEWCQDATPWPMLPYGSPAVDPVSLSGSYRVIRGGSWYGYAGVVRAAYRFARPPGIRGRLIGVRLAGGVL